MKQTQVLTPEQDQALRAFAAKHRRKQALYNAWMRRSDSKEMRRIRNAFGPDISLHNLLDMAALAHGDRETR